MITEEKVKTALEAIKSGSDLVYFFTKIKSPEWIIPLDKLHVFSDPPDEGVWPPLQYLKRISETCPDYHETIGKIALNLPATNNILTHCECIDIIINIKTSKECKIKIIEKEVAWVQSLLFFHYLLVKKNGELLSALAKDGFLKEALTVAETLLDFSVKKTESKFRSENEIVPKYDWRLHQDILEKKYPDLVNLSWNEALILLCRLLDRVLQAERNPEEGDQKTDAYSYIWRRTIESSNHASQEIKDLLITAIIKISNGVLEKSSSSLNDIISIIERYKWDVFTRVSLYLHRNYSVPSDIVKIQEILTDDQFFAKTDIYHEYYELLKKYFSALNDIAKDKIIKRIIDKDFSDYKIKYDYTDEQVQLRKERWQIQHLEPILGSLPAPIKSYYEELLSRHGDSEHKGFSTGASEVWMGPESPISSQDLELKTPQELIEYLRIWNPPPKKMFGPSKRGLGRILEDIIAKNPEKYVSYFDQLSTIQEPTYASSAFSGLRNAINQNNTFAWGPVIDFCLWVLDNQNQVPPRDPEQVEEFDIDPDWTWTKHTIASLFYAALSSSNKEEKELYPFKDSIWKILESLSEDPNPSIADEEKYSDSEHYDSLAVNSVRGEALHAVIHYALWQYRKLESELGKEKLMKEGFNLLPEVKQVLEKHLNKTQDPLIAIHTVYGQWLPWLVLLDNSWVKNFLGLIFPTAEGDLKYRRAVWKTYIGFCSPYNNVFEMIKSEYDFWISKLPGKDPKEDNAKQLAQHLMAFYWRGLLELKDLQKFFDLASPETRSEATAFMGLSLRREEEKIPEKILLRFRNFWEHRFSIIKKTFVFESHFHEIDAFVWWFESMAFDLDWAFQQLRNALELIRYPQHDTILLDFFKTLSADETLEEKYLGYMVDCLYIMITSEHGKSRSQWWQWDAELILEQVMLRVQDEDVRNKAKDLINFIGALGHFDIRKLLQISPQIPN